MIAQPRYAQTPDDDQTLALLLARGVSVVPESQDDEPAEAPAPVITTSLARFRRYYPKALLPVSSTYSDRRDNDEEMMRGWAGIS